MRSRRGGPRARKVGIVAVARKLLVLLWRYLETGQPPPGAAGSCWQRKVSGRVPAHRREEFAAG